MGTWAGNRRCSGRMGTNDRIFPEAQAYLEGWLAHSATAENERLRCKLREAEAVIAGLRVEVRELRAALMRDATRWSWGNWWS